MKKEESTKTRYSDEELIEFKLIILGRGSAGIVKGRKQQVGSKTAKIHQLLRECIDQD